MNKHEFLEELRARLSVIEENELRDILAEYEQHITMKTESGAVSEEAAIADFGSIEELAGDILEAYHVRADCQGGKSRPKAEARVLLEKLRPGKGGPAAEKEPGEGEKKAPGFFQKMKEKYAARRLARRNEEKKPGFWAAVGRGLRYLWEGLCHLVRALGRLLFAFLKGCWLLALWLLRWAAKIAVGGVGAFIGLAAALLLIAFGCLLVLQLCGYPVLGLTLITLGLTAVGAALMFWCFGLLPRFREQEAAPTGEVDSTVKTEFSEAEEEDNP